MENQTADREKLYTTDPPEGNKVRIHVNLYTVADKPPGDGELRVCARALKNGRAAGMS